ncbi:MAG: hypothetical protein JWP57_4040 [Spirosoma sp.]|nr:hypothetical protein [Spirosoma sp.]
MVVAVGDERRVVGNAVGQEGGEFGKRVFLVLVDGERVDHVFEHPSRVLVADGVLAGLDEVGDGMGQGDELGAELLVELRRRGEGVVFDLGRAEDFEHFGSGIWNIGASFLMICRGDTRGVGQRRGICSGQKRPFEEGLFLEGQASVKSLTEPFTVAAT